MSKIREILNLITSYEDIMLESMRCDNQKLYKYAKEMKEYYSEQLIELVK